MAFIVAEKKGLALGWANWQLHEDQEFEITLDRPKSLAGKVVDEQGNPIAEGEVSIMFLMVGTRREQRHLYGMEPLDLLVAETDEQGDFAFKNIPSNATAEFLVRKAGRATVCTFSRQRYSSERLQFASGRTDIKIEMPAEARLEGLVVKKGTITPAAGVELMLTRSQNEPVYGQKPVTSNENGRYSINGLAAGEYTLQLVPPTEGLGDWVAGPVTVAAEVGKTTADVRIEVFKGGILEVVVMDAETLKPLGQASLNVRHDESNQWFHAASDEQGVARLRLVPGEYRLSGAYKEGYTYDRGEQVVAIEDDKTERIEVALAGQPRVTGITRDPEGKPVEEVKLKVLPASHEFARSDAEGKFEVSWDPRHWGQEEIAFYLVARHEARNLAVAIEIGRETRTLDVNLVPAVAFTGRVVDPSGKGIPEAKINVMMQVSHWGAPITDWQRGGATTDSNGRFEVKGMPPEHRYSVTATAEGYGKKDVPASTDDATDNRLDVGELALALANLSVSGVVVDVNDKPVAGARIHAYGQEQPERIEIPTDAQGKFTIDKVCAGRIQVSASVRGEVRLRGRVETEGGAQDIKIVVSERGSSGRFVPRQPPSLVGKPLPDLKALEVDLSLADANSKMILVCFFDMEQRPSRHMVREVARKVQALKEKGVTVVLIQASKIDENALSKWVKKNDIEFMVGMIENDEEKIRFAWGVRSLPWLILADRNHIVSSNGFMLSELDEKLVQLQGE
jgi:hypothetical protein